MSTHARTPAALPEQPGDREVRRQLRLVLANNGLPAVGALYDRADAYIREHY